MDRVRLSTIGVSRPIVGGGAAPALALRGWMHARLDITDGHAAATILFLA